MKWIKSKIWRLQFKKVKFIPNNALGWCDGRCTKCDAGNPTVECSTYYCPCNRDEQLKRVYTFKWLYKK